MGTKVTENGMMLQKGHWFMWPIDEQIPQRVSIFCGSVLNRKFVTFISRGAALALWRYYGHKGLYYSYIDAVARYHDVRVCGDIDAWFEGERLWCDGPKTKE
jgi:hypothetical protein